MGKTLKDKANHFIHHLKPSSNFDSPKAKYKYDKSDIPDDVKKKVDDLSYSYSAGLRRGINRKWIADMKIVERKIDRRKQNNELNQEIKKLKP